MTRHAQLAILCVALSACRQATGVLLTIDANGVIADQLRVNASTPAHTLSAEAPAQPASTPFAWPQSLLAELDLSAPATTRFHVEALRRGVTAAAADSAPIVVTPGNVTTGVVYLGAMASIDAGAVRDLASPGNTTSSPDLATSSRDLAPALPTYATTVLADQPAGYWPLTDSGSLANDLSGNMLNGKWGDQVLHAQPGLIRSDGSVAQFSPGMVTGSAAFAVTVGGTPSLQPTQITVELWTRPANLNANFDTLVIYDGAGAPPYAIFRTANNQFRWQVNNLFIVGNTTVFAGYTYHVVGTLDGTSMSLYVNGSRDAQGNGTPINYSDHYTLAIGSPVATYDPPFNGRISEVAIYGSVLSEARIQAHYQARLLP
jgi:hypothetical protein